VLPDFEITHLTNIDQVGKLGGGCFSTSGMFKKDVLFKMLF
jgi:hypothetical protein